MTNKNVVCTVRITDDGVTTKHMSFNSNIRLEDIENKVIKHVLKVAGVDSFGYPALTNSGIENYTFTAHLSSVFYDRRVGLSIVAAVIAATAENTNNISINISTVDISMGRRKIPTNTTMEYGCVGDLITHIEKLPELEKEGLVAEIAEAVKKTKEMKEQLFYSRIKRHFLTNQIKIAEGTYNKNTDYFNLNATLWH